jgi:hypothetical protein
VEYSIVNPNSYIERKKEVVKGITVNTDVFTIDEAYINSHLQQ